MNPYLLSCCGSYVCEGCLLYIQQSRDTKCPSCESLEYDFECSPKMKENVEYLLVKCSNGEKGCKWRGQLAELDIHLFINCLYAEITCENGNCGSKFLRCDASKHICSTSGKGLPSQRLRSYSRSASCIEELSHRITEMQKKQDEELLSVKHQLKKFHSIKVGSSGDGDSSAKLTFEVKALKRQLAESLQREQALEKKVRNHEKEINTLKETHDMFRLQFDNLIGECGIV